MTPPDLSSQFQRLNKKGISGRNCGVCMRCCSISRTTTVTPHLSRNSSKQYTLNTPSLPTPHSSLLRYNAGPAFLLSHPLSSLGLTHSGKDVQSCRPDGCLTGAAPGPALAWWRGEMCSVHSECQSGLL